MRTAKLCQHIIDKIQTPGATLLEIADLIQTDQFLADRIISLVNRSYCSSPQGVTDIRKALHYIGITSLLQLLIGLKVV